MNRTHPFLSKEHFARNMPYVQLLCIAGLMSLMCLATVIGNALVILSFIIDKKLRTLNNYFLFNLAISDIMIGTFSMPLFTQYLLKGEWTLGPVLCDMWLAEDYMCSNASCFNILLIGFDRYFSVTNPLRYRAKKTAKRVVLMISCVWIISFLLWPPWIYAWPYIEGRRTVPEDKCYVQFLETNFYLTIIVSIFEYYILVLIMFVLYYKIWRVTIKRGKYLADMEVGYHSESTCSEKKHSGNKSQKTVKLFLVCYSKHKKKESTPNIADADLFKETADINIRGRIVCENGINDKEVETVIDEDAVIQKSSNFNTVSRHNTTSSSSETVQSNSSSRKKTSLRNDKATRVLTAILLLFIITTTPYNILVIIKNIDSTHSIIPDAIWNFFYYLYYVNSTLNPLCYALANETFRKTYWKIFTCTWSKKSRGT